MEEGKRMDAMTIVIAVVFGALFIGGVIVSYRR